MTPPGDSHRSTGTAGSAALVTVLRLNRQIFEAAAHAELPAEQRELAFRRVLIARCLERVADNAVDIAEQAAFVVTAEVREFSDASQPRRRT